MSQALSERNKVERTQTEESIVDQHLSNDKNLIHQYLEQLDEAELHFFWTTGRTLSDHPGYHPNTNVLIGGSKYGHKFLPYLDILLKNSPKKLKIKLVCDQITEDSNKKSIESLKAKYGSRFEILPIKNVLKNMTKAFPLQTQNINRVFKNATEGNPVIVSDNYRLVGMMYGHEHSSDVKKKQFTYSDIDTFCFGIESENHSELIRAFFEPQLEKPFYLGRHKQNNDVIKLHINELDAYEKFCNTVLDKMQPGLVALDHFSKLHDLVKLCEKNAKECSDVVSRLPDLADKYYVEEVTHTTGPVYLDNLSHPLIHTDLEYPRTLDGSWAAPEDVLNYKIQKFSGNQPSNALGWILLKETQEEKDAQKVFDEHCDHYRKVLSAALYARRFGDKHPFNIQVAKYLIDHFPYKEEIFKNLLKVHFKHRERNGLSYEDWKSRVPKKLKEDDRPYDLLTNFLKELNIEGSIPPEFFDLRK